ncbi:uncharacterized protein LOC125263157 [Megalobrama amblycephala]|uniref:uncharacterized protein LOC125263157 n=1 Tax=Megalobrama amblycephala TaxID=75352 RepID=UPI00201435CD|nr:uncharacterized protein LOC125263157 [Megalobrama amblycephala]
MNRPFVFLTVYVSFVHGVSGVDADGVSVSVKEGDSIIFHTGVQTNQQDRIIWYFNDIRIAKINRDQSKICTDVQCNEGTERFRDRLKLDHQTGSLTITNTRTEHAGRYHLEVISSSNSSEKIFSVSVHGVSAADTNEVKMKSVMEGQYIMLDTGVIIDQGDSIMWYFNDNRIAYISWGPEIWKSRRFRDRLQLDHQTGSLNIRNVKTTDTGQYKLEITNSSSIQHFLSISSNSVKRFSVTVSAVPGSGLSSGAVAGICVPVVLLVMAVVIYCCHRTNKSKMVNKG